METVYTTTPEFMAALAAAAEAATAMPMPANAWNGLAGLLESLQHIATTLPTTTQYTPEAYHRGLAALEGVAATLEGLREVFDPNY